MFKIDDNYKAIVIGGSAGSFPVITRILNQLPEDFEIPIIMAMHRLKHIRHGFLEALAIKSSHKIIEPHDKELIRKGVIYLAPANYHLSVELGNTISLTTEEMYNNSRPSIDLAFETASYSYKNKLIGILLSGANKDGAMGMAQLKKRGGLAIVQDPSSCVIDTMPKAAMNLCEVDYVLNVDLIIDFLYTLNRSLKDKQIKK